MFLQENNIDSGTCLWAEHKLWSPGWKSPGSCVCPATHPVQYVLLCHLLKLSKTDAATLHNARFLCLYLYDLVTTGTVLTATNVNLLFSEKSRRCFFPFQIGYNLLRVLFAKSCSQDQIRPWYGMLIGKRSTCVCSRSWSGHVSLYSSGIS